MKVILCLDEKNGMLFNNRRLSMDRVLREDLLESVTNGRLWMNRYSFEQFRPETKPQQEKEHQQNESRDILITETTGTVEAAGTAEALPECNGIQVSEDFLEQAGADDYCFVENVPYEKYVDEITEMIVYKWNRTYPSDVKAHFLPWEHGFALLEQVEFKGFSHEKITKEIYKRKSEQEIREKNFEKKMHIRKLM